MTNHGNVDWGDEMRANQNKPKEQKTLREQLTEWVKDYKDVAERNALAETPEESAKYLLSLMLNEVEGINKLEYDNGTDDNYYVSGWNEALEAVKKLLGKV